MRRIVIGQTAVGQLVLILGILVGMAVQVAEAQDPPGPPGTFYFEADFEDGTFANTGNSGGPWGTHGSGINNGTVDILDDSSSGTGQSKILRMTKSIGDFFGAWQPGPVTGPNYVVETVFRVNQGEGHPALLDSPQIFRAPHVGNDGVNQQLSNDFWVVDEGGQLKLQSWQHGIVGMDIEYNTWYKVQGQRDVLSTDPSRGVMKYWVDGVFWRETTDGVPHVGVPGEFGPSNGIGDIGFANTIETGSIDWDYFWVYDPLAGEVLTGDMDCDGDVDFDDIDDFVLGLNDATAYESTFGVPATLKGDTDGDNDLDFDDITGFVALLSGGAQSAVPEPSSWVLLGLGLAVLACRTWHPRWRQATR